MENRFAVKLLALAERTCRHMTHFSPYVYFSISFRNILFQFFLIFFISITAVSPIHNTKDN